VQQPNPREGKKGKGKDWSGEREEEKGKRKKRKGGRRREFEADALSPVHINFSVFSP
jgi:hypothetical protein